MAGDPHDLARFLTAQDDLYATALAELQDGAKYNHWMWFIFPQMAGLGFSPMARLYAIHSAAEAGAFLAHPVLGQRLRDCTRALLTHEDSSAEEIMGSIDAVKLCSSLTLFDAVAPSPRNEPFADVLELFYDGSRDARTLELLNPPPR